MYINLLINIKNAEQAGKAVIKVPHSTMDYAVAEVLKRYGFISRLEVKGRAPKRVIEIEPNMQRPIHEVAFLSKPSTRTYKGYRTLKPFKSGFGLVVLSTPNGIKAANEAKKEKVGGQMLFKIW
jgi:small subunit ribosomal protein S8